jgi:hypothetical protein
MSDIIAWLVALYVLFLVVKVTLAKIESQEAMTKVYQEADRRIRMVDLQSVPEHNALLAYDKENNQFLAQGTSVEDVKRAIMARFPDKIFILQDKVFSALPHVNGEITLETSKAS